MPAKVDLWANIHQTAPQLSFFFFIALKPFAHSNKNNNICATASGIQLFNSSKRIASFLTHRTQHQLSTLMYISMINHEFSMAKELKRKVTKFFLCYAGSPQLLCESPITHTWQMMHMHFSYHKVYPTLTLC